MELVYLFDMFIITFGLPFLICIQCYLLKKHLELKEDLKLLGIDLEEYKKLSDEKKNNIIKMIKEIKKNNH